MPLREYGLSGLFKSWGDPVPHENLRQDDSCFSVPSDFISWDDFDVDFVAYVEGAEKYFVIPDHVANRCLDFDEVLFWRHSDESALLHIKERVDITHGVDVVQGIQVFLITMLS